MHCEALDNSWVNEIWGSKVWIFYNLPIIVIVIRASSSSSSSSSTTTTKRNKVDSFSQLTTLAFVAFFVFDMLAPILIMWQYFPHTTFYSQNLLITDIVYTANKCTGSQTFVTLVSTEWRSMAERRPMSCGLSHVCCAVLVIVTAIFVQEPDAGKPLTRVVVKPSALLADCYTHTTQ